MTATCAISTWTNPVTSGNDTAVVATGTCTAANTVSVRIRDENGTAIGPVAATVVGTGWSLAATDISSLQDGTVVYEATATDGSASAFAAKAADKDAQNTLYISLAELREYIHDPSLLDSDSASRAIVAACRKADELCDRVFYQTTEVRYFSPDSLYCCEIDDLATTTGLIVQTDSTYTGAYSTTLTNGTDFVLEPHNRTQGGIPGWPYTSLRSLLVGNGFPLRYAGYRDTIKITGTWGWAAVPDPVKQACFVLAAFYYWLGNVPSGWQTGDFGALRARGYPSTAEELLGPFMRSAGGVVVA